MLTRAERLKLFRMVSLVREWLGLTIVLECARRQGDLRRVRAAGLGGNCRHRQVFGENPISNLLDRNKFLTILVLAESERAAKATSNAGFS